MIKKLFTLLFTVLFGIFSFSAVNAKEASLLTQRNYYEAYTLCNNYSYSGSKEGIHAGWTYDNRAGNFIDTILTSYNAVLDNSTTEASCLYRELNYTDEGKISLETTIKITNGFDGLNMFLNDRNGNRVYALISHEGEFKVVGNNNTYHSVYTPSQPNESVNVKVFLDLDTLTAKTVLNNTHIVDSVLSSDNLARFGFGTTPEDIISILPGTVKITANYHLDEEFKYDTSSNKTLPYGWNSTDIDSGYIANGTGYASNNSIVEKYFEPAGGKLAIESYLFINTGETGAVSVMSGTDEAIKFTFDGTYFRLNGVEVYENTKYLENFWHRFRIEADLVNHTAKIYVNGRVTGNITLPDSLTYINGIRYTATGKGISFDDILVHSLIDKADYVPQPIVPTDSQNHLVGINICSLWSYESSHGWYTISPYEDYRPILGYYDEGSPETADWEIKMMVEHGIDFQAFCWYADNKNAPLKYPRNMLQLHEGYMYAKYSDMMDYAIIWEASNGAHPANSQAFRNYFVPHWIEYYFKDDRYLVIDNKPVLFCFGYGRFISDVGGEANAKANIDYLREELRKIGFDGLILIVSNSKDSYTILNAGADGVCAYNWGTSGKDLQYSIGRIEDCANVGITWTVPTLSTGFNSIPWHGKRYGNMLPEDFENGLLYMRDEYFNKYPIKESWQEKLYMLSTWNEYGEGTYIMPCEELYGFGYLEAIRNVFTDGNNPTHSDLIPTTEQLDRITKNYPQRLRGLRRNGTYLVDDQKSLFEIDSIDYKNYGLYKTSDIDRVSFNNGVSGITKTELSFVETTDDLGMYIKDSLNMLVDISVSEQTEVSVWYTTDENTQYNSKNMKVSFTAVPEKTRYYIYFNLKDVTLNSIRVFPAKKAGVAFTLRNIAFCNHGRVFIDGKLIESSVYPEEIDGLIYYPFDPKLAQGYIMDNSHYEWDYATKTLSIYGKNGRFIKVSEGSDIAITHNGNVRMPKPMYLSDNLPMLHMETVCDALGFEYSIETDGIHIKTPEYESHNYIYNHPENEWDFTVAKSTMGFFTDNATLYVSPDNELYVKALDGDPRTRFPNVLFPAEKYSGVEICMKYENKRYNDSIGIFFTTEDDTSWDERKFVKTYYKKTSSNGKYETITLDFKNYKNYKGENTWTGMINALRIDFFNAKDSECWVKYIKFIPNPDYVKGMSSQSLLIDEFFDAEDGKIEFVGTSISIVNDPVNENNKVYYIDPIKVGTIYDGYIGFNYKTYFEPGVTYRIEFDYLGGKIIDENLNGKTMIHVDPRYYDLDQINNPSNIYDHVLPKRGDIYTNDNTWRTLSTEFTIKKHSLDRGYDELRIYTNPVTVDGNRYSLSYYVDNVKITKVSKQEIADINVTRSSPFVVKLRGSVDSILPANKNIFAAFYDADGRLLDMKSIAVNNDYSISYDYNNAQDVAMVKVLTLSGFKSLIPKCEALEFDVRN